jgi:hypothetical protein
MNHPIRLKTTLPLLIALVLACLALSPRAQALLPPPAPDGGYPGANTAEGTDALFRLTTGIANTAVGLNALHDNTTGGFNVAIGSSALANNTTGSFNMAIGTDALRDNNANFNLAIGFRVLFKNTTGNHLTGIGAAALRNNTTAGFNTAIGADALRENTTGINNTAIGADALAQNTIAEENTATGASALSSNNEGDFNTADGAFALVANTEGGRNTATGDSAMFSNTTGSRNTASGNAALGFNTTGNDNTAIGFGASPNTTGSSNIAVGAAAGSNVLAGNNNINIGSPGSNTSNAIRIGNGAHLATFIAGISGVNEGDSPTAVFINTATGQLGTTPPASSRRFKKEIKPMDQTSEAILGLKPVTFRYKSDSKDTPQFGLIAEEVAQIDPDLVVRDENGDIYTVRYDAVNAMLLNEFLKEHRELQELKKQVAALTAGLQKVSAQLEAGKPAPQVVNNP